MARIVIVAPAQPSRTPRLVRNANALAEHGHDVTVVTPVLESAFVEFDEQIARRSRWRFLAVELLSGGHRLAFATRASRKLMSVMLGAFPLPKLGSFALMYGAQKIADTLSLLEMDLILAQQQAALPLVANMARSRGVPYGCDIEDILTESDTEQVSLLTSVERSYLPGAGVISTMSKVAANHLVQTYSLAQSVVPLHNCCSIAERSGLIRPRTGRSDLRSIYWFGQTLGPHSLAVELIQANAKAGNRFRLAFRGRPADGYLERIQEASRVAGSAELVEVLPVVEPSLMVSEAAKHDVLFGSQPSDQLFHQLAIGNKVFTGLAAGCALLLTDTIAHRELAKSLSGACRLVARANDDLVDALNEFSESPEIIDSMKQRAWDVGTSRWNWETESADWLAAVDVACARRL